MFPANRHLPVPMHDITQTTMWACITFSEMLDFAYVTRYQPAMCSNTTAADTPRRILQ